MEVNSYAKMSGSTLTPQESLRQRLWDLFLGSNRKSKMSVVDVQQSNCMFNASPITKYETSEEFKERTGNGYQTEV